MLDVYAGSIIVVKFNGAISACRYTYTVHLLYWLWLCSYTTTVTRYSYSDLRAW